METININVDDTEYTAVIPNGDGEIILNDKPVNVKILSKIGKTVYSVSVDNQLYIVDIQDKDNDFIQIYTDGFMFEVELTNEKKKLIQQYLKDTGAGEDTGYAQVKAPMPGLVIKIPVSIGDEVKKGDNIIIIEAMKMENAISSPISGVIKTINATEGKSVEKAELLIEIESNK